MSSKACDEYTHCKRHRFYRRLFACILAFIILVLFVILIIWLVLRPTKPKFYLRDLSVPQFNITGQPTPGSNYLSCTLQATVSSRNPNDRIGIYYDRLDVYAVYKDQQVTVPSAIPSGYQGHNDIAIWSPFIYGTSVPVSNYLTASLSQDQNAGFMLIGIRVDGKLRWKVGSWVSDHYHIFVTCPAFMTVDRSGGLHFQGMTTCHVDV